MGIMCEISAVLRNLVRPRRCSLAFSSTRDYLTLRPSTEYQDKIRFGDRWLARRLRRSIVRLYDIKLGVQRHSIAYDEYINQDGLAEKHFSIGSFNEIVPIDLPSTHAHFGPGVSI